MWWQRAPKLVKDCIEIPPGKAERNGGHEQQQTALKVIGQAFDEAWQEIAGNFGDRRDIEAGRFRLANAVFVYRSRGQPQR